MGMLQLRPIEMTESYRKKWNIYGEDYVCLFKNGKSINNSVYRVGGFGGDIEKDYFLLLKYVEAYYSDTITKKKSEKRHLEGRWCIIDKNGIEKVVFESFKTPYLEGGVIYSVDQKYYNIETGEFYCTSYSSMKSKQYLFLNNQFDDDEAKRGVMKINMEDGTYELFK